MLRWAVICFVAAIIEGVFGFSGIASAGADIARILFFIVVIVLAVSLIMRLIKRSFSSDPAAPVV